MNHTAHKDWANKQNSILIEPDQQVPIYDDIFFKPNQPFNQGNFNVISDDNMINAFEKSEKFTRKINKEGLKLQKKFSYKKTLDKLIKIIKQ